MLNRKADRHAVSGHRPCRTRQVRVITQWIRHGKSDRGATNSSMGNRLGGVHHADPPRQSDWAFCRTLISKEVGVWIDHNRQGRSACPSGTPRRGSGKFEAVMPAEVRHFGRRIGIDANLALHIIGPWPPPPVGRSIAILKGLCHSLPGKETHCQG